MLYGPAPSAMQKRCKITRCVYKTDHMHDLVIGLFINRYEFGRAL